MRKHATSTQTPPSSQRRLGSLAAGLNTGVLGLCGKRCANDRARQGHSGPSLRWDDDRVLIPTCVLIPAWVISPAHPDLVQGPIDSPAFQSDAAPQWTKKTDLCGGHPRATSEPPATSPVKASIAIRWTNSTRGLRFSKPRSPASARTGTHHRPTASRRTPCSGRDHLENRSLLWQPSGNLGRLPPCPPSQPS